MKEHSANTLSEVITFVKHQVGLEEEALIHLRDDCTFRVEKDNSSGEIRVVIPSEIEENMQLVQEVINLLSEKKEEGIAHPDKNAAFGVLPFGSGWSHKLDDGSGF